MVLSSKLESFTDASDWQNPCHMSAHKLQEKLENFSKTRLEEVGIIMGKSNNYIGRVFRILWAAANMSNRTSNTVER